MRLSQDGSPGRPLPLSIERPKPGTTVAFLALLTAATVVAGGRSLAQEREGGSKPGATPQQSSSERAPGVRFIGRLLIGDRGPDFNLLASDGSPLKLRQLRDLEAVALVFLQKADPSLDAYATIGDSLRAMGVRLVFVCQQRLPRGHPGWPAMWVLHDRKGEIARRYGAYDLVSGDTIPAMFVIDRHGYVRYIAAGVLPRPDLVYPTVLAVLPLTSS